MQLSITSFAILAATIFQLANAQIRLTDPIGESLWEAGKPPAVQWRATKGADLSELGTLDVSLWAGSKENMISLQQLGTVAASEGRLPMNAIATDMGPSGDYYFVRLHSSTKDKTYTSGKFTIQGMTGAFNASMQATLQEGMARPVGPANTTSSSRAAVQSGVLLNSTTPIVANHKASGSAKSHSNSGSLGLLSLLSILAIL